MSRDIRVIGLGGSLAESSTSRAALRIALEGAQHAGASTEFFDVRTMDLPMYRPGSEPPPEEAVDEEGQARDERVDVQLRGLGTEVVRAARQFAAEGTCDYAIPGDPASSPAAAASAVIE